MINIMRLFFCLLLTAVLVIICGPEAFAQQNDKSKAISIEPFLQEVILEPTDASKTFSVMVTNNTASIFRFNVTPVDFGTLNDTGGIFFTGTEAVKLSNKYGLADWIEIEKTDYELLAGEKTKISVTLANRGDLAPGGHYGAIFINSKGSGDPGNTANVALRQSISALILAVKRGGEKYDLGLSSVNTNGGWFKPPTQASLRFKNNGNTHIVPRGIVNLSSGSGQIYSKGVINENSSYILPETHRIFTVDLKNQKNHPFSLVRSYKVEVIYRYDGLDRFATKTITLRLVNWPALLGALAVIIAISIYLFRKYSKSLNSKKLFRN